MSELRMPKINEVRLSGRLTRDPEFKVVGSKQTALALFTIAFDEGHMGVDGWVDKSGFVDSKVWAKMAEKSQELHKGSPIILEGKLTFETWQTDDGKNRSKLSITGFKIHHLSKEEQHLTKSDVDNYQPPTTNQPDNNTEDNDLPF